MKKTVVLALGSAVLVACGSGADENKATVQSTTTTRQLKKPTPQKSSMTKTWTEKL